MLDQLLHHSSRASEKNLLVCEKLTDPRAHRSHCTLSCWIVASISKVEGLTWFVGWRGEGPSGKFDLVCWGGGGAVEGLTWFVGWGWGGSGRFDLVCGVRPNGRFDLVCGLRPVEGLAWFVVGRGGGQWKV